MSRCCFGGLREFSCDHLFLSFPPFWGMALVGMFLHPQPGKKQSSPAREMRNGYRRQKLRLVRL